MRHMKLLLINLCPLAMSAILSASVLAAPSVITPATDGVVVETERYRATISQGAVTGFLNKLTGEEYLDQYTDLQKVTPHLPGGLGTQATDTERESAFKLYKWPWWEHPATSTWPNHHFISATTKCAVKLKDEKSATVTYTGLTDGTKSYPDETVTLEVAVDAETGDLLVTPIARSPRPGVYSSSLTIAPLGPAITAEAPIFDGVRLDRNMQPMLWVNQWGGYWDYGFLAFNGYKKGAVAVWCQDAELKYYKYLHYLINPEGISFSLTAFNIPPFDKLKEAGSITWRLQAFEKGWSQAVARFRDWRLKNVQFAKRPDWANQISFVNGGVNAGKMWVNNIDGYFNSNNVNRTITFAATIRGEGFDKNHANNTPYKNFKEDMNYWKERGPKLMAYLQPMIMWGPKPETDREKAAVAASKKANTISVFQKSGEAKPVEYIDQHHLGEPEWQRWFLDWVKEYIQDYGADAVYHDQSYHCPVDARGLAIGGKTSTQGMADYFYKAQTESPNSLHGTEHMTEVNNVGASLGIGSGILWGTAESMRKQRIDHPSPISNALHWPNGALFAFPHYSQINQGNLERIHWGMNISEGRGELPYAALQSADATRNKDLVNERWLDVVRSHTFVNKGLRAVFPADWDRNVFSYFQGANGEDVRYLQTAWGSAFIEIAGGKTNLISGRIHGTPYAQVDGGIFGWPFYNARGPAGLHPNRYYVIDPQLQRPAAYFSSNNQFSPSLYEGFVEEGFANDQFAYIKIKPRENLLDIIRGDSVLLNASEAPKAVFLNGKPVQPKPAGDGKWEIRFELTGSASIVAILKDASADLAQLKSNSLNRVVGRDWPMDQYTPNTGGENGARLTQAVLRAPADQGPGKLELTAAAHGGIVQIELNGVAIPFLGEINKTVLTLPFKPGEQGLLSVRTTHPATLSAQWITPPATTNAPAAK
ncbi:MAG: hypothetical protein PCFJNLEI_04232 [Verrucomicrobiae bacterium]|nr:hypothetical protein [Verrucomicrobiae bacterium]